MELSRKRVGFSMLTLVIGAGLVVSSAFAKGKAFTGTVGDALCGVEHSMPVSTVECIRQCIGKGANYSLIVGDQVYVLETSDKAVLETLEKQAGERVKVTGIEKGKTIVVSSVKAAKP
jgi:putative ribosome biogenesis GTPase RsgA